MDNISYIVRALAILSVRSISKHMVYSKCPEHKPFYTDVGCVYRCPEHFFINGSSCVVTCGDWFTYQNRQCQPGCLDGYFIKEVVRAIGSVLYLERQCVAACDSSEFIHNGTCVEACPTDVKYIFNQACVQNCPDGFPLIQNFTKGNILYHVCLETCPVYEEDNHCTRSCSKGKLQFNNICVDTCPKSQKVYVNQCIEHCPPWWPLDANKTCVSKCPLNLPFIHNSSCVANCPEKFPLSDKRFDGSDICVDVCGQGSENQFLSNKTCVSICPAFTFNRTCVEECPDDNIIVNNVTIGKNCRHNSECTDILQYSECVDMCPSEKFLLLKQHSCVDTCPSDMVSLNRTCFHSCDGKVPYSEETTVNVTSWSYEARTFYDHRMVWKKNHRRQTILQCVHFCSDGNLKLNYSCVQKCPGLNDMPTNLKDPWNETSQYFRYGRTCVKKCPENHTFVGKETNQHCWSWNCEKILHLQCLSECPENTYMYRNLCLSFCPGHLFLLGMALVESCPQQQHLHLKREVVVTENSLGWERTTTKSIFECVSNCREKLIQNNSCVDNCPVNEPYLRGIFCHNNTCGAKYELKTSRGIECLTECPEGTLHSTNKCTTKCPDELKFNSNSICVNQCPSSSPFGVDINKDSFSFYDKKSEFKCLAKCEDNKVYKRDEEACIYSYKCEDPDFVYAGQCLKSCPSGYKWFLSCFHQFAAIVCSVIVILLTLIYGYCCFPLFKETCSFITICRQYKKNNSSEDSAKNLLQLANDEEPNDPVHPENTTAIDMADISVFQTFNSSYINTALEADINI